MPINKLLWTLGGRFNGLLKSQHVIASLRKNGPQTKEQIWESIKDYSGIKSKNHLTQILKFLKEQYRVKVMPDPNANQKRANFIYEALKHRKNDFPIPETMEPIIIERPAPKKRIRKSKKKVAEENKEISEEQQLEQPTTNTTTNTEGNLV